VNLPSALTQRPIEKIHSPTACGKAPQTAGERFAALTVAGAGYGRTKSTRSNGPRTTRAATSTTS
jgi:hypothetical protein